MVLKNFLRRFSSLRSHLNKQEFQITVIAVYNKFSEGEK